MPFRTLDRMQELNRQGCCGRCGTRFVSGSVVQKHRLPSTRHIVLPEYLHVHVCPKCGKRSEIIWVSLTMVLLLSPLILFSVAVIAEKVFGYRLF